MSLNLRYRLAWMSDAKLAGQLNARLADLAEKASYLERKPWWSLSIFSPHTMKRPFIRHRLAYRVKAMFVFLLGSGLDSPWLILIIPFIFWFMGRESREEITRPFSLYLARCEVEDLTDELQRRVKMRQ